MITYEYEDYGMNKLHVDPLGDRMTFGVNDGESVYLDVDQVNALIGQLVSWLRRQELVEEC